MTKITAVPDPIHAKHQRCLTDPIHYSGVRQVTVMVSATILSMIFYGICDRGSLRNFRCRCENSLTVMLSPQTNISLQGLTIHPTAHCPSHMLIRAYSHVADLSQKGHLNRGCKNPCSLCRNNPIGPFRCMEQICCV